MASIDELLKPSACALYAKASTLESVAPSSSQRARLLESMSDDIKKCTNFVEPEVSEAALAEAEPLKVDLRTRNWHDQPSFDAGREIFAGSLDSEVRRRRTDPVGPSQQPAGS